MRSVHALAKAMYLALRVSNRILHRYLVKSPAEALNFELHTIFAGQCQPVVLVFDTPDHDECDVRNELLRVGGSSNREPFDTEAEDPVVNTRKRSRLRIEILIERQHGVLNLRGQADRAMLRSLIPSRAATV